MLQKLKTELKARDLDITGKKADLAERLEAHLQAQPTETSQQANGASSSAVAQNGSNEATAAKVYCPASADLCALLAAWCRPLMQTFTNLKLKCRLENPLCGQYLPLKQQQQPQ